MDRDAGDALKNQTAVPTFEFHVDLKVHAASTTVRSEWFIGWIVGAGTSAGVKRLDFVGGGATKRRLTGLELQLHLDVDVLHAARSTGPCPRDSNGFTHSGFDGVARDRNTVYLQRDGFSHRQGGQPPGRIKANGEVNVRSLNFGLDHVNVHQRHGGFQRRRFVFAAPKEFQFRIGGGDTEQHGLNGELDLDVG